MMVMEKVLNVMCLVEGREGVKWELEIGIHALGLRVSKSKSIQNGNGIGILARAYEMIGFYANLLW